MKKKNSRYDNIIHVEKFNPYHDQRGRFASANGASFMTTRTKDPSKQHWADKAMERARQQGSSSVSTSTEAQNKTLNQIANKTRNLKKEQLRVVDKDGNVVMERKGQRAEVSYTVGEAREHFHGNITIHNHPDGGTFSSEDLRNLGYGATEIRVASPEGDYIIRNIAGKKPKTLGWLGLQESLDAQSGSFKEHRVIKKEVKAKYQSDFDDKVLVHANNWLKAKESGASMEEQQVHIDKYNKAKDAWEAENNPKIEKEVRKAFTGQYHNFYVQNASKYELEYEFIPKSVKKGIDMTYEKDEIAKTANDGEIVLDAEMYKTIQKITEEIIKDIVNGSNPANVDIIQEV